MLFVGFLSSLLRVPIPIDMTGEEAGFCAFCAALHILRTIHQRAPFPSTAIINIPNQREIEEDTVEIAWEETLIGNNGFKKSAGVN